MEINIINQFVNRNRVDTGIRFLGYVIDLVFPFILVLVETNFTLESNFLKSYLYINYFVLMFLSESIFSTSLGKRILGNIVVNKNGRRIFIRKAFLRTLIRFIPFETFPIVFHYMALHDLWSKTYVVNKKEFLVFKAAYDLDNPNSIHLNPEEEIDKDLVNPSAKQDDINVTGV
jgi:hypothetical protein